MSTTPNWRATPRSTSCAPRSSWNRDPNPNPIPARGPNRRPRSPNTPMTEFTSWRITLPHLDAAKFDAALASHHDALIAEWKRDHDTGNRESDHRPPMPGTAEAFMRLVEAGWDAEVARRPHGQHTTVVVHVDVKDRVAALHLGPLLSDSDRRYLTCDATVRSLVPPRRAGHRRRPNDPADQPAAAPRAGAPPSHLRGARMRGHPRSARPPHPALGRRRPHRPEQPGPGLPLPPPAAPPRHHHHHRTRPHPHRHRQRRPRTQPRITCPPTNETPTRRGTVARLQRRTRRLVVVPTLPTATTTNQQLGPTPHRR